MVGSFTERHTYKMREHVNTHKERVVALSVTHTYIHKNKKTKKEKGERERDIERIKRMCRR